MAHLQLTTDFETYLYSLVDGIIEHISFTKDYIVITTDINNYIIRYDEIK